MRKEHKLSSEESDRIVSLTVDVFGDSTKAHIWLRRPNRALENKTPLDLLHSEVGTRLVETLLERIQHGIYS